LLLPEPSVRNEVEKGVAAAAYRSGERLQDERTGETFDYRARGGVLDTFIIAPEDAPAWAHDRAQLWNEAERAEPRANGRLATEFELALPFELDAAARKQLVTDYLAPIIAQQGVAADIAIHEPGEGKDHRNEAAIAEALASTMTGTDFAAAIDKKGLTITRATAPDVQALDALRAADLFAGTMGETASGNRFADIIPGDLAAVTRQGDVFRLSPQKLDFEEIEQRLADVQTRLPSVVQARALNEIDRERKGEQRAQNDADFIASRLEQADMFAGRQELRQAARAAENTVHTAFETPAAAAGKAARKTGKVAEIVTKTFETAIGLLFGGFMAQTRDTRSQTEQKAKARDNVETLHAEAVARDAAERATRMDDLLSQIARSDDIAKAERYNRSGGAAYDRPAEHGEDYERER
jgi:hypothetical protein